MTLAFLRDRTCALIMCLKTLQRRSYKLIHRERNVEVTVSTRVHIQSVRYLMADHYSSADTVVTVDR